MKTYPLDNIGIEEARCKQFRLIDEITKEFKGTEILSLGDLGISQPNNQPKQTRKVEKVLATYFNSEEAILVRGAGTGAIREGLSSLIGNGKLLVHSSPIYSTTKSTIKQLGIKTIVEDFNDLSKLRETLRKNTDITCVLIQYTRQSIDDSYNMEDVISELKSVRDIKIITDDNYAVMKVSKIGVELGATISCFSMFKLLGPEGIGCIVGDKNTIDIIRDYHYSGGSQVQGFEAMEALRALVYTPVSLAIQAEETEKIVKYLNKEGLKGVKSAYIANSQSKVVLVEFEDPIAEKILKESCDLGAAPIPVGSESKYEIVPMFYRLSGTMRKKDQRYTDYWIRINPMRSGCDTVIRILKLCLERVL